MVVLNCDSATRQANTITHTLPLRGLKILMLSIRRKFQLLEVTLQTASASTYLCGAVVEDINLNLQQSLLVKIRRQLLRTISKPVGSLGAEVNFRL